MIIHRPLMLNKEECEEILHALRRAEADVNLRVKVRNFIMNEFKSYDVDYAIDELLSRNVKGATRPIHHQSRCVKVPIQTYVDAKPRLKPLQLNQINAGERIACFDDGVRFKGVVAQVSRAASGTYYIRVHRKYSELDLSIKVDELDACWVKFYKVLDHGSC